MKSLFESNWLVALAMAFFTASLPEVSVCQPLKSPWVSVSNKAHDMMKGEVTPETFQKLS